MCDPLSCTFHLLSPTVHCWVICSGRVARRAVISGVWPLSLLGLLLYLLSMQGLKCKALSLKNGEFSGEILLVSPQDLRKY